MSSYIINVTNTSGETGTVVPDIGFSYSDLLNSMNKGNLKFSSLGQVRRGLLEVGSIVDIKRNGVLEFKGQIQDINYLTGGGIVANLIGYEVWLGLENGDYSSSPYVSTASTTIFSDIIGESTKFTAGTINTGLNTDFRISLTSSLWNAISNLAKKTQQDTQIDYDNLQIDILNHKGSSSSVLTLNSQIDIGDVRVEQNFPIGNDIRVYGKGEGGTQIKSDTASGQDAASKSTYGIIRKIILDPSIMSISEANELADAEVQISKDPIKVYDFDVFNFGLDLTAGDVITLNARSQNLNNEEVRIVGIERGQSPDNEFMMLQVTNKEHSNLVRTRNDILGQIEKNNRDQQTYMQGTTNVLTFSGMINAKLTAPLNLTFNIPDAFIKDEANNLRVMSFTLDYDLDPFRDEVGVATESDVAPDVLNASGNTQPTVFGTSADTNPPVSGTSANENPNVSGNSGLYSTNFEIGVNQNSSYNISAGLNSTILSRDLGTAQDGNDIYADVVVVINSGGPEDIEVFVNVVDEDEISPLWSRGIHLPLENFNTIFRMSGILVADNAQVSFNGEYAVILNIISSGAANVSVYLRTYEIAHIHDDGSYQAVNHGHDDGTFTADNHGHDDGTFTAANHGHDDGTYNAEDHNHSVNVDGDVTDSGSVNSNEVDIFLDFWNGSSWVNKHSIINTGKILDTDLDISDSGTYPDTGGYWRVRIYPNSSSADLVHAVIKLKHQLDT